MLRVAGAPFHPLLLSLLVPVGALARNAGFFQPADMARSALAMAGFAALALLLARLALGRWYRAGLAAALAAIATWPVFVPEGGTTIVLVGLAVLAVAALVHWRTAPAAGGLVLNLFAVGLLAQPVWALGAFIAWQRGPMPELLPGSGIDAPAAAPSKRPNIVHIVADAYAADRVLREELGFDNGAFSKALGDLGFVVFPNARAPYNQTLFTMAAVLNAAYVAPERWPLTLGEARRIYPALGRVTSAGAVRAFLRPLGYRFLYADSGYSHLRPRAPALFSAPEGEPPRLNLFEDHLLARSALAGLYRRFNQATGGRHAWSAHADDLVRHALTADLLAGQEPPYHLYLHLLAPHPPFTLDRAGHATQRWSPDFASIADGDHATGGEPALQRRYVEGYLEKLRYLNRALLARLPGLLAELPAPKVVILHGDHGSGSRLAEENAAGSCLKERFSPYLAVYASDPALRARLAELARVRFNLVNLYRVVLDGEFGTDLGLLEDRSAFAPWETPVDLAPLDEVALEAPCPPLGE